MTRKQMCVCAGGVSLLMAAGAEAAIIGLMVEEVDFSDGYVLADGSIEPGTAMTVGSAWKDFDPLWDVHRLWATVSSALSTVGGVGGSVDKNIDLILDAGSGGMFYNNTLLYSDTSQNPAAFTYPGFATAAFDTWVTIGAADGATTVLITEPNDEFGSFASSINCQNCGWTTTPGPGNGVVSDGSGGYRVLLGQFTVIENNTFSGKATVAGGGQIITDTFTTSHYYPAPGGLVVIAIATVNPRSTRRRRRR